MCRGATWLEPTGAGARRAQARGKAHGLFNARMYGSSQAKAIQLNMAYLVLARKYRPTDFDGFVGQDVIAETLRNAIRMNRVAHAYLFCGPRGVGKTSMARVFAKALNCEKGPTVDPCGKCPQCGSIATGEDVDVIEIDGASNNSVDQVRELRQNCRYAAARSRFKIYYIDEVHMLSAGAFNALLKTLEEPPPHVKFIFATTAASKLPETILSRVQRFDFKRISNHDIVKNLGAIGKKEKLKIPEDVLALAARRARGSMRDALSLLDQIISFCGEHPDADAVSGLLGTLGDDELARIIGLVRQKDCAGLLKTADELLRRGMDVGELIDQLQTYVRDLLVGKTCGPDPDLLDRPADSAAAIVATGKEMTAEHLLYMAEALNSARRRIRDGHDERIVLEMTLVKLGQSDGLAPLGEIMERLVALEEGGRTFGPSSAAVPPVRRSAGYVDASPSGAPAVREEGPRPKPLDMGNIPDVWQRVKDVAHERSMTLYMCLGNAHLQRLDKGEAVLAFPENRASARREIESPEARKEVQKFFAEVLGRPMTLHIVSVAGNSAQKTEDGDVSDPMIQSAVRRFDGEVVRGG